MKENLFFRATKSIVQKREFNSIFLNLILLPLLCISSFFNASALEVAAPQQDQQAIIYVGENAFVYGVAHVSNARVVKIQNPTISTKIKGSKKKSLTLEGQIVAKKSSKNRELQLLQQKINRKVKNSFYLGSHNRDFMWSAKGRFASAATTTDLSFKYHKAALSIKCIFNVFRITPSGSMFFTSHSYSKFDKLRNSFLRGPPCFIYFSV